MKPPRYTSLCEHLPHTLSMPHLQQRADIYMRLKGQQQTRLTCSLCMQRSTQTKYSAMAGQGS